MTWFKIDDGWWRSKKLTRVPRRTKVSVPLRTAAAGVWSALGDWSADQLTDGFVPDDIIADWDPTGVITTELIRVRFWVRDEVDGDTGIRFLNWEKWNPTEAQVEKKRTQTRDRVRAFRDRKALGDEHPPDPLADDSDAAGNGVGNALPGALVTAPPTRPDPTRTSRGDLGGGAPDATARDSNALPRAAPHDPPCEKPCRRCQAARLAAEADTHQAELAAAADLERRRACRRCDPDGWQLDPDHPHRGPTSTRCTHQPELRSVTA